MVHPIIVGYRVELDIFNQPTMWEPRGFALGEIGASPLVLARSRCSPLKGGSGCWGPLIHIMLISGLHIDLLENEATP